MRVAKRTKTGQREVRRAKSKTTEIGSANYLLTPAEAAAILSVAPRTVYDWVKLGRIKKVPIGTGREYRISRAEIDRFIADSEIPGNARSDG